MLLNVLQGVKLGLGAHMVGAEVETSVILALDPFVERQWRRTGRFRTTLRLRLLRLRLLLRRGRGLSFL